MALVAMLGEHRPDALLKEFDAAGRTRNRAGSHGQAGQQQDDSKQDCGVTAHALSAKHPWLGVE